MRRWSDSLPSETQRLPSYAGTEQLALRLPHWKDLFSQVHATDYGTQALYRVVRYLHQLGDERAVLAMQRVLYSIMESRRAEAFMRTMEEVLKERGHRLGLLKGRAEGKAEGKLEGYMQGKQEAILAILRARGLSVSAEATLRIQSCLEEQTLNAWISRAATASSVDLVLTPMASPAHPAAPC